MSIKNVHQHPVSYFLNPEEKWVYEIPKYQREYTWTKPHWQNLFDDILENNNGYFLGTIICINNEDSSMNVPRFEVVDGQQRLTTISLLLCALYSSIAPQKNNLSEEQSVTLFQLKRKLALNDSANGIRVVPQIQNHNLDDYKGVLAEQGIISQCKMPSYAGHRKIKRAFEYFKNRIIQYIDDNECDILLLLFDILEKVNAAVMVMIEVTSHSAAYTLFESLNNRGVPLTAVDLIKNLLLSKLDKNEEIDDCFARWQDILENIGDDYNVQERFFRHNYNAFRHSLNKPFIKDGSKPFPLAILATRSNLMDIYEKIIARDPVTFLYELTKNSELYSKIIVNNKESSTPELYDKYLSLSRVQGAPSYLLLLYLEKNLEKLSITDIDIANIVEFLVTFFVRRNVTDAPPTRDLTNMFMGIIDDIEHNCMSGEFISKHIKEQLTLRLSSNEVFEDKLRGSIYDENSDIARFILCRIAENEMTRETKVNLWKRDKSKKYIFTIEHIFPQGDNIPEEWVDMIANGDAVIAKEIQSRCVHTFGNLTITAYNSNLSNFSFEKKKERTDKDGRYIGYRNGLSLNIDVVSEDKWTENKINTRTDRLVAAALEMFKL